MFAPAPVFLSDMAQRPISRHTDFLDALHELYDLLVALAALPCGIQQPPHAIDLFDASAVRAAGYDEGVVCLLARMPYLDVDAHFSSLQLLPSTYPVTYVGEGLDEGYYASQREMFDDDEQMMPATALRLTKGEGLEGTWLIYDMKTGRCLRRLGSPALLTRRRTHDGLAARCQPAGRGRLCTYPWCFAA